MRFLIEVLIFSSFVIGVALLMSDPVHLSDENLARLSLGRNLNSNRTHGKLDLQGWTGRSNFMRAWSGFQKGSK